jgi:uncharacterized protein YjeT (DUF2065 family)
VEALLTALSLVLVIEGLLPFAAPALWRRGMQRVLASDDAALRRVGLVSMALGLVLLYSVR